MTSLRFVVGSIGALALLTTAGCSCEGGMNVDAGVDGGADVARTDDVPVTSDARVIRSCDEALGQPDGAPCDFAGTCLGTGCTEPNRGCVSGRLVSIANECVDAGGDAPAPDDAGECHPTREAGECRTGLDCAVGFCMAPDAPPGCGICFMPEMTCRDDGDCADTDACVYYEPRCSCGGEASECRERCTTAGCPVGESCDASNGRCSPTSCTAGFVCPAFTDCAPLDAGADAHGCVRPSCETDDECACGAVCVEGRCFGQFGVCGSPPA